MDLEFHELQDSLYTHDTQLASTPLLSQIGFDDHAKMPYMADHPWDDLTPPYSTYGLDYCTTWLHGSEGIKYEGTGGNVAILGAPEPTGAVDSTLAAGNDGKISRKQWSDMTRACGICGQNIRVGCIHSQAPSLKIKREDSQSSVQPSSEMSWTCSSTPSLTSASSRSSTNSSVRSNSRKPKPRANRKSKLSSTPRAYEEMDHSSNSMGLSNTLEETSSIDRSRVQSYDSATDSSCSPEPVWSQPASEPSVSPLCPYESNMGPSIDESGSNSNTHSISAKEQSHQNQPLDRPMGMTFQSSATSTDISLDSPETDTALVHSSLQESMYPVLPIASPASKLGMNPSLRNHSGYDSYGHDLECRLDRYALSASVPMHDPQYITCPGPEKGYVDDPTTMTFWYTFDGWLPDSPELHNAVALAPSQVDNQHTFGSFLDVSSDPSNSHEAENSPYHFSNYASNFTSESEVLDSASRLQIPAGSMDSTSPASSVLLDPVTSYHSDSNQRGGQQSRAMFTEKSTKVDQPTPCPQNPDFQTPSTVSDGKKSRPQKRKQFQCIFCDVEYTTKNAWLRHETELHESPKKWQCPDCKATFLNETHFTRHHKQNHSCHDCQHSNEAKIELPRKTAWACGFCADVFQDWEKRCEHVAAHFVNDGRTKNDWDFSNVISGLLAQKWVRTAWQSLLARHHGTSAADQPKFQWLSTNQSCLELQQDLEHGQGEYEGTEEMEETESRLEGLVRTAYRLGTSECPAFSQDTPQVLPKDSESIANENPSPQSQQIAKRVTGESISVSEDDDASSLDEYSDDNYDTDEEAGGLEFSSMTPAIEAASSLLPGGGSEFLARAIFPFQGPFIDSVVDDFLNARFGPSPGLSSLAGSDQTNSSTATGGSSAAENSKSPSGGGGRKRGRGDEPPLDRDSSNGHQDGNGEDPNKRRRGNLSTRPPDTKKRKRYACPYYQRDPELYGDKRSCIGPGWTEVHRVKDHLYKHHARPTQCQRCWDEFSSDSEFANHQNDSVRCAQREKRIAPGFNKEQERLLRSKKKFNLIKNPDDTWKHIYSILFPDDKHIPRPHYSAGGDTPEPTASTPGSIVYVQMFEEYRKRTLPDLLREHVRKRLESDSESESNEIRQTKENIERMITSIFQDVMDDLYRKYNETIEQQSSSFPVFNNIHAPAYTFPAQSQPPRHSMTALYVAPPSVSTANSVSLLDFNQQHQRTQASKSASDSGYYSAGVSAYGQLHEYSADVASQAHVPPGTSNPRSAEHEGTSSSTNPNASESKQLELNSEEIVSRYPALQFEDSQSNLGEMLSPIETGSQWPDSSFLQDVALPEFWNGNPMDFDFEYTGNSSIQ